MRCWTRRLISGGVWRTLCSGSWEIFMCVRFRRLTSNLKVLGLGFRVWGLGFWARVCILRALDGCFGGNLDIRF